MAKRNGMSHEEAGKLSAESSRRRGKKILAENIARYEEDPKICEHCGNKIPYEKRFNRFCGSSCSATFNNTGKIRNKYGTGGYKSSLSDAEKLERRSGKLVSVKTQKILRVANNCLLCGETILGKGKFRKKYCNLACSLEHKRMVRFSMIAENPNDFTSKAVKKYLLHTRGHSCESCKNTEWMGVEIPLEIEHIDGNSYNHNFDNVLLLCPNCHALTPTYKGRNTGNGRHERRKRYKEGKSY